MMTEMTLVAPTAHDNKDPEHLFTLYNVDSSLAIV